MTAVVAPPTGPEYLAAIETRRRRKCIAEDAHTSPGLCPRCGLTEGTL